MTWVSYQNHPLYLKKNIVHVWRIFLPDFYGEKARFSKVISSEELASAKRYVHSADGDRYLVAKAFQRIVLSKYLAIEPSRLCFAVNDHGKPYLIDHEDCRFNLSHSGDYALLAVTRESTIGVDVERERSTMDVVSIANRYFSQQEKMYIASCDVADQREAFYECWVKKEAFAKATGLGLSFPLSEFVVNVQGSDKDSVIVLNDKVEREGWWVRSLEVVDMPRYHAALSGSGSFDELICWSCQSL